MMLFETNMILLICYLIFILDINEIKNEKTIQT